MSCSECRTYGYIPHEKEGVAVWTREKKRRARAHAASVRHVSRRGKADYDHG